MLQISKTGVYLSHQTQTKRAMKTVTYKNREFQVVDLTPISNFPNLAAAQPNVEFCFTAVGKRGAGITGYITKNGGVIVF